MPVRYLYKEAAGAHARSDAALQAACEGSSYGDRRANVWATSPGGKVFPSITCKEQLRPPLPRPAATKAPPIPDIPSAAQLLRGLRIQSKSQPRGARTHSLTALPMARLRAHGDLAAWFRRSQFLCNKETAARRRCFIETLRFPCVIL